MTTQDPKLHSGKTLTITYTHSLDLDMNELLCQVIDQADKS